MACDCQIKFRDTVHSTLQLTLTLTLSVAQFQFQFETESVSECDHYGDQLVIRRWLLPVIYLGGFGQKTNKREKNMQHVICWSIKSPAYKQHAQQHATTTAITTTTTTCLLAILFTVWDFRNMLPTFAETKASWGSLAEIFGVANSEGAKPSRKCGN